MEPMVSELAYDYLLEICNRISYIMATRSYGDFIYCDYNDANEMNQIKFIKSVIDEYVYDHEDLSEDVKRELEDDDTARYIVLPFTIMAEHVLRPNIYVRKWVDTYEVHRVGLAGRFDSTTIDQGNLEDRIAVMNDFIYNQITDMRTVQETINSITTAMCSNQSIRLLGDVMGDVHISVVLMNTINTYTGILNLYNTLHSAALSTTSVFQYMLYAK